MEIFEDKGVVIKVVIIFEKEEIKEVESEEKNVIVVFKVESGGNIFYFMMIDVLVDFEVELKECIEKI